MSEIKYEIVKKVGVLSSPLCPSDISPKCGEHEFGGGEYEVGTYIRAYAKRSD